ncbi:hypothetical protein EC431_22480 [Salmonella enterica subsp. enterica serovar Braenderup]|nr:hypothetical protein [Escherichia coli]EAA2741808.1 hypothetical protein [Salmonella enterica subsp. enterica serovar Infantis]EAB8093344.1 hypothetical protein [Salmonella enterica subsp. enterica serovar Braenderup]EAR1810330.1 hypothetical protein [Salmonella enterica]EEA9554145.1 hypothetical protein [Salmonella enterica subsp. enterica serovar Enteritidis]EIK9651370.1 hypothetical protein [Salmonella enterica subsp. enterica serovar Schwarzengrund]PKS23716.1 hypothetical protein CX680
MSYWLYFYTVRSLEESKYEIKRTTLRTKRVVSVIAEIKDAKEIICQQEQIRDFMIHYLHQRDIEVKDSDDLSFVVMDVDQYNKSSCRFYIVNEEVRYHEFIMDYEEALKIMRIDKRMKYKLENIFNDTRKLLPWEISEFRKEDFDNISKEDLQKLI